ncbi:MAG TPA: hypothetical protein VMZ71_09700 [Gemmataceae bacterium]|nr:hypothetical protein [Gemmataceae bacterium]
MNRPPIRRALTAAVACALLVAAGASGCNSKRTSATLKAGGANTEKAEKARKMAEALATEAVRGGAAEQAKLPAFAKNGSGGFLGKAAANAIVAKLPPVAPRSTPKPLPSPLAKVPPRPTSPVVISDRVSSSVPYTSPVEADEDALVQAQERVEQRLRELRPPITVRPSLDVVRREYVRRDTRTIRQPDEQEKLLLVNTGYSGERVYVEYEIQITADQVRELRSQERVSAGVRVTGMLVAVALAGFLFLRADEWTKGYLTRWLAFAAVLLAGGVAAALIFV